MSNSRCARLATRADRLKDRIRTDSKFGKFSVFVLVLIAMFFLALYMSPVWLTAGTTEKRPFNVGEYLRYDIKWGIFKVGEAEMFVENAEADCPGELKFVLLIRTISLADAIYKVRNRIESFTDGSVTKALLYVLSQRENGRKREVVVTFDWDKNQAQFSNYGKKLDPIDIYENSHDPFSVLFAYRKKEFVLGEHIRIPVTDGKRNLVTDITLIGREKVKVRAGRFDCLRVELDTKNLGGVYSKRRNSNMDIWFSDDEDRLIVKMTSAVSVGSYRAELRDFSLASSD